MSSLRQPAADAKRTFGVLTLGCLVVGNMIGSGVYTSSGFALETLHTPSRVLMAWAIAGIIAIAGAFCYAGLARQMTESGGEYLFLSRAVHPLAGFLAGWISLTAGFSGAIAYAAVTFERYLPSAGMFESMPPGSVAVLLIGGFTLLHAARLSTSATGQNLLVLLKLALIVALLVAAAVALLGRPAEPTPLETDPWSWGALGSWGALASSLMWLSFSYAGYNAAIYVAGSARQPERSVPRAMLVAAAMVTLLYLGINAVILTAAPVDQLRGQADVAAIAAAALGGPVIEAVVRGVILLSLATSVSAMIQAGPHVYAQMARDRLFPTLFLPTPGRPPRGSIALQAALAISLVFLTNLQQLLDYLGFVLTLTSAATAACLFLPRFRGRAGQRPTPWYPWLPAAFVVASVMLALMALRFRWETDPRGIGLALLVLPTGLVAYALARRRELRHPAAAKKN